MAGIRAASEPRPIPVDLAKALRKFVPSPPPDAIKVFAPSGRQEPYQVANTLAQAMIDAGWKVTGTVRAGETYPRGYTLYLQNLDKIPSAAGILQKGLEACGIDAPVRKWPFQKEQAEIIIAVGERP